MQITNISEAKTHLSSLIKQVQETDEPILIGKSGQPIAVLSAFKQDLAPRKLGGSWEGKVNMLDDFNEPLNELSDTFYNSALFPKD